MTVASRRLAMAALACVAAAGCGAAARRTTAGSAVSQPATESATANGSLTAPGTASTTAPGTVTTAPAPKPKPKPDPGSLPQTHQLPSAGTARFHAEMAALWKGIRTNSVQAALPAFFPERAYAQLKQIGDPQGDWADRLMSDYRLDIAAAHALLGSNPESARLIDVQVPQSYAHWVPPAACYNGVGYYEVPNARVVYRQDGEIRSFGIASMISWRGVWYVVHLGAILRPSVTGMVDDPSSGRGESVPSSTC